MCVGLIDLIRDALHAFFEAAEAFAETLAELRQFFTSEQDQDYDSKNDEMCWCEEFAHCRSPCSRTFTCADRQPLLSHSCGLLADTLLWTGQMGSGRYILDK